jgi:ABC-type sulfate transport system permease subunit
MAEKEIFEIDEATDNLLTVTMVPATTIAGWAITFTLKVRDRSGAALITRTVGSGITITDAVNGVFTVLLTAANTTLTPGVYSYDIRRTDAGSATTLTYGFITIRPGVLV